LAPRIFRRLHRDAKTHCEPGGQHDSDWFAHAKKAQVTIPPLEEFERNSAAEIVQVRFGDKNQQSSKATGTKLDSLGEAHQPAIALTS
jgi:hypothetical protein